MFWMESFGLEITMRVGVLYEIQFFFLGKNVCLLLGDLFSDPGQLDGCIIVEVQKTHRPLQYGTSFRHFNLSRKRTMWEILTEFHVKRAKSLD